VGDFPIILLLFKSSRQEEHHCQKSINGISYILWQLVQLVNPTIDFVIHGSSFAP